MRQQSTSRRSIIKLIFLALLVASYIFSLFAIIPKNKLILFWLLLASTIFYIIFHGFYSFTIFMRGWTKRSLIFLSGYFIFYLIDKKWHLFNSGDLSKEIFWFRYSMSAMLYLVTSVIYFECIVKLIKYGDILELPLSISNKKKIIFFKTIFVVLSNKFHENQFLLDQIPELQHNKINSRKIFLSGRDYFRINSYTRTFQYAKENFNLHLVIILSLLSFVIEFTKINGMLIDNRIDHNYK